MYFIVHSNFVCTFFFKYRIKKKLMDWRRGKKSILLNTLCAILQRWKSYNYNEYWILFISGWKHCNMLIMRMHVWLIELYRFSAKWGISTNQFFWHGFCIRVLNFMPYAISKIQYLKLCLHYYYYYYCIRYASDNIL